MHAEVRAALARACEQDRRRGCSFITRCGTWVSARARIWAIAPSRPGGAPRPISANRSRRTTSRWSWPCGICRCRSSPPSTASRRARAPTSRWRVTWSSRPARRVSCRRSRSSGWCPIRAAPGSCRGSWARRGRMGLALLGEKLTAEQAAQWGLIWRCVEDAEFAAVVDALARSSPRRRRRAGAHQAGDLRELEPYARAAARRRARLCSASWAAPPTTPKASRRSRRSARRTSRAVCRVTHAGCKPGSGPQAAGRACGAALFARDHASQALGIRIVGSRPGYARLAMVVRGDMVNGHRMCHGGMVFTLADSAFAFACNSLQRSDRGRGRLDRLSRRRA